MKGLMIAANTATQSSSSSNVVGGKIDFSAASSGLTNFSAELGLAVVALQRFNAAAPATPTEPSSPQPPRRRHETSSAVHDTMISLRDIALFMAAHHRGAGMTGLRELLSSVARFGLGAAPSSASNFMTSAVAQARALLGPVGIVGAAITAVGAASIAVLFRTAVDVSRDMAQLRMHAMGMGGIGVGNIRAARAAQSWMAGPENTLENIVHARRDITSDQRLAFTNLFGGAGAAAELQKKPGEAMLDFYEKAGEKLRGYSQEVQDTMAETLGMTAITSMANIRAQMAMTPDEWAEHKAEYREVETRTALSPRDEAAWAIFNSRLKASAEIMEGTIIKWLTPLAAPLGQFSMFIARMVNDLKPAGDIIAIMVEVGRTIGELSPLFSALAEVVKIVVEGMHLFLQAILVMVKGINDIVDWIRGHMDLGSKLPDWMTKQFTDKDLGDLWGKLFPGDKPAEGEGQPAQPQHRYSGRRYQYGAPQGDGGEGDYHRYIRPMSYEGGGSFLTTPLGRNGLQTQGMSSYGQPQTDVPVLNQTREMTGYLKKIADSMDQVNAAAARATVTGPGGEDLTGTGGGMVGGGIVGGGHASAGLLARGTGPSGRGEIAGGHIDTSGAGVSARPAKGALAANQAEAYKAARAAGLSDSSAKALVANMSGEALGKPGDVHWDRTHWARGIVQWDPARSAAIQKQFGKLPNEMSVGEQTKAAIWEMKTNPAYKKTWDALSGEGSTESKVGALVTNYERPADSARAVRERLGFLKGLNVGGEGAAGAVAAAKAGKAAGAAAGGGDTGFFDQRNRQGLNASSLNATFAANLKQAATDAEKATGQKLEFTSLARTREEQARLYYNYTHHIGGQGLAARPGTSLHEKGDAADMAAGPARDWVMAHASQYGMETLGAKDPEHIQMAAALRARGQRRPPGGRQSCGSCRCAEATPSGVAHPRQRPPGRRWSECDARQPARSRQLANDPAHRFLAAQPDGVGRFHRCIYHGRLVK